MLGVRRTAGSCYSVIKVLSFTSMKGNGTCVVLYNRSSYTSFEEKGDQSSETGLILISILLITAIIQKLQ